MSVSLLQKLQENAQKTFNVFTLKKMNEALQNVSFSNSNPNSNKYKSNQIYSPLKNKKNEDEIIHNQGISQITRKQRRRC